MLLQFCVMNFWICNYEFFYLKLKILFYLFLTYKKNIKINLNFNNEIILMDTKIHKIN